MTPLLAFSVVLLAGVLLSCVAHRTAASVSVLFLAAGFALALPGLGVQGWPLDRSRVESLARAALLAVLFTDGMRIGIAELRAAWRLPGRALLLGLPITLVALAVLAHLVLGLDWMYALLVGAVLTPTDPVFASALVEREEVPQPLSRLLNVESGLNDGLALPIVILLLEILTGDPLDPEKLAIEVAMGVVIGAAVPAVARALRPDGLQFTSPARPFYALALGLLAIALAGLVGANEFLAAFSAGVVLASVDPRLGDAYHALGAQIGQLLKFGTLLVFGGVLATEVLGGVEPAELLFAGLALFVARPMGMLPSLLGSRMPLAERFVAAWFGPKGFASLVYAIMVLHSSLPNAERLFRISAIVVALSIVLHSSSDVPVAKWFERRKTSIT